MADKSGRRRPALRWAAFFVVLIGLGCGGWFLLSSPNTPLPRAFNPVMPLNVMDPENLLTRWKLERALSDPQRCIAALATGADARVLPDFKESAVCSIRPQVELTQVGQAKMNAVRTRCQTALRTAMWAHHGVQPAAKTHLGSPVVQIIHASSYSCRQMRTTSGGSTRMSTHATANAIDIRGFILEGGGRVTLLNDWVGESARAAFLRDVRDAACVWFRVTLGPEYNALHADHFHLQHTGFGLCR
ncbi:extensin family protein [Sulfitobacter aestuariivivens]|uniref:Extensin family protein n=1 Tax=Sulfitobacter aestuariivivens TaxID=2766981 RepID=A0A927HHF1_9RHOB|nr:extensin family protein [Sulfitobacter aestuariivivens]MBD3665200.1 extensin family protein [Sulfitobacter aestuariivivens]